MKNHHVAFFLELVGEQELQRTELEFDHSYALERAHLGLTRQWVFQNLANRIVRGQLGLWGKLAFGLAKTRCLNNRRLCRSLGGL